VLWPEGSEVAEIVVADGDFAQDLLALARVSFA
jgi:hypothetical protein